MRITRLTIGLLVASHGVAAAQDFSGFYAGINAGYARRSDAGERQAGRPPADRVAAPADASLPPSARTASETLRARGRSPATPR